MAKEKTQLSFQNLIVGLLDSCKVINDNAFVKLLFPAFKGKLATLNLNQNEV
jgi:hypothetical protein